MFIFFQVLILLVNVSIVQPPFFSLTNAYRIVLELTQLSGIAAILRFPLPELEEENLSDHDEEKTTIEKTVISPHSS
jgi:hypothetical protein